MKTDNKEVNVLQRALEESYARSEHLLEHISHGVVIHDISGAIIEANSQALQMLGLNMDQLQGRTSLDSRWRAIKEDGSPFPGDQHPAMLALRNGKAVERVVMGVYHPEGDKCVWIKISAYPRFNKELQQVQEVVAIFEDISQQQSLLQERNRQNSLEEILIKTSRRFLTATQHNVDQLINDSLEQFGRFLMVDRTYIFRYDFNRNTTSNTHEWCAAGIAPQIDELQAVPAHLFPDWLEYHLKGDTMFVEEVKSLPAESTLRQILEPQGIQSLIAIPILSPNEECLGFVGCDAVNNKHHFHRGERDIMKLYADLIARLWLKMEMEFELRERLKELNCIYEITRLSQQQGISQDYLQRVVDFIPPGFLHPEKTLARIVEGHELLAESGFILEAGKTIKLAIACENNSTLHLEVVLEKGLDFLPEEYTLLHRIVPVVEKELLRKNLESKRKEANQRLERIFQSQNTYQLLIDLHGRASMWNRLFDEHFAWSFPSIVSNEQELHINRTLQEEDQHTLKSVLQQLKDNPKDSIEVSLHMHCINRTLRTVRWELTCLKDEVGNPTEILGIGVDETEKIKSQQDLELFKKIVDQSLAGHGVATLDGSIRYVNKAMADLHQLSVEEMLKMNFNQFYGGSKVLQSQLHTRMQQLTEQGYLSNSELRFKLPNGATRTVLSNAVLVEHHQEQLLALSMNDLTAIRESEAELKWLRNALDDSPVTFVLVSKQGIIRYVSRGIERQAGYTPKELLGKNSIILSSVKMLSAYQKIIAEQLNLYGNWAGEWLSKRKDGSEYWERISITRLNASEHHEERMLIIKQDISELKHSLESVERQNELLKSIAWTQSHVVRAPLSRILGLIALMEDKDLMDGMDEADLRKGILNSAHELDEVIRDIVRQAETPIPKKP